MDEIAYENYDNYTSDKEHANNIFSVYDSILPFALDNIIERRDDGDFQSLNFISWNTGENMSQLPNFIYNGDERLMTKFYIMNEHWLGASTNRPKQRSVMGEAPLYDQHAFMKFVPSHQGLKDKPYKDSGYYQSTVKGLEEYYTKYITLHWRSVRKLSVA